MELFLFKNQKVTFSGLPFQTESGLNCRVSPSPLISNGIDGTIKEDGSDNSIYARRLTTALNGNSFREASSMRWNLKVAASLPDPSTAGKACSLFVYDSTDNLMAILHKTFNCNGDGNENVKVNLTLKNLELKNTSKNITSGAMIWKAKGLIMTNFGDDSKLKKVVCDLNDVVTGPEKNILLTAWKNGEEICGVLTVCLVLNNDAIDLLHSMDQNSKGNLEHFKKMLEKEICTDLEIHVEGQGSEDEKEVVVKCHRAVLAAGSEVFQRMFESGMREATGNRIEIEEMSEEGVRAFLAYLYYKEVKAAYQSSAIAMELLQAAEKYCIQELKDTVREYMMAKGSEWFGVEMALGLYGYCRVVCLGGEVEMVDEEDTSEDDEDGDGDVTSMSRKKTNGDGVKTDGNENDKWKSLKIKCLKVLKWYNKKKPKTMMESVKYKEIFRENPELGMEIQAGMFQLD